MKSFPDEELIRLFKQVCIDKGIDARIDGLSQVSVSRVWNDPYLINLREKAKLKAYLEARAIITLDEKGVLYSKGPGWELF